MVDLFNIYNDESKVIVENVPVMNVRWKVDGPSTLPQAPTSGHITVGLSPSQRDAVKSVSAIAVKKHKDNPQSR